MFKLVNINLIISGCQKIEVKLHNKVWKAQKDLQGTYRIGGIVNGRRSWKTDSHAIWFVPKYKGVSLK